MKQSQTEWILTRLKHGPVTAIDALDAAMPGGSVTGAPKHRACEIITALEGVATPDFAALTKAADGLTPAAVVRYTVLRDGATVGGGEALVGAAIEP